MALWSKEPEDGEQRQESNKAEYHHHTYPTNNASDCPYTRFAKTFRSQETGKCSDVWPEMIDHHSGYHYAKCEASYHGEGQENPARSLGFLNLDLFLHFIRPT